MFSLEAIRLCEVCVEPETEPADGFHVKGVLNAFVAMSEARPTSKEPQVLHS